MTVTSWPGTNAILDFSHDDYNQKETVVFICSYLLLNGLGLF